MKVLDLFSGLGGFSQAFRDRGHHVITVDIEKNFKPSVVADVRFLPIRGKFDIILASPPCDEFSKASMPWYDGVVPDMTLLKATVQIIQELKPRFWVIENVRGAIPYFEPYLGGYRQRCGSRYLWGNFPRFYCRHEKCYGKWRLPPSPMRKALRSKIPYEISLKLCLAVENALRYNLSTYSEESVTEIQRFRRGDVNARGDCSKKI